MGFQSLSKKITVSAAVRLMPSPPARVLRRNTKTSSLPHSQAGREEEGRQAARQPGRQIGGGQAARQADRRRPGSQAARQPGRQIGGGQAGKWAGR